MDLFNSLCTAAPRHLRRANADTCVLWELDETKMAKNMDTQNRTTTHSKFNRFDEIINFLFKYMKSFSQKKFLPLYIIHYIIGYAAMEFIVNR